MYDFGCINLLLFSLAPTHNNETYRRLAIFVNKKCALDFRHIICHVLELAMRD